MSGPYLVLDGANDTVTFPVDLTIARPLYLEMERLAKDYGTTVADLIADACQYRYGDRKATKLKFPTQIRLADLPRLKPLITSDMYDYGEEEEDDD